jgi:hypothetical protein
MLDLCIIGAPKCGTSSLFRWLTAHPEVVGPKSEKELFFFMDEGHPLMKRPNIHSESIESYRSLFPDSSFGRKIEGTTHYLYQSEARRCLSKMESSPLIVVIVRDPAERVWSSFQYTRNNLARMSQEIYFSKYVDKMLSEKRDWVDEFVSHSGSAYVLKRDIDFSKYVEYLLNWREEVGRGRLLLFSFETLVSRPRATCQLLASTLNVDPKFYDDFDFEAQNTTYGISSSVLHALARRVGRWVPDGRLKQVAKQTYMKIATTEITRNRSQRQAIQRLKNHFHSYNKELARHFNIDISSWS